MHLKCYQTFCCCFDAAFGSIICAAMTAILSLIFMGISIERLIKATKLQPDTNIYSDTLLSTQDVALLKGIPAVNMILSILLLIASIALVIGAAHKHRRYVATWIVVMPVWLIFCITQLALTGNVKYQLHDAFENGIHQGGEGSWFVVVAILVGVFGFYSICCVSILLYTLLQAEPITEFKSLNVSDALHLGLRSGYGRLRESVRYASRRGHSPHIEAQQSYRSSHIGNEIQSSNPVVLNPGKLQTSSAGQTEPVVSMTNLAYIHDEV